MVGRRWLLVAAEATWYSWRQIISSGGTLYQPVAMVTSQGQVLTQALPPGAIQIQNSQVKLSSHSVLGKHLTINSQCAVFERVSFCCTKPPQAHIFWALSEHSLSLTKWKSCILMTMIFSDLVGNLSQVRTCTWNWLFYSDHVLMWCLLWRWIFSNSVVQPH